MIYLGHDLVKPSEQHGTIKLTSSKGVQYLYDIAERDVDLSNPSIKHGDDLVVTVKGPTCYIPDEYFQLQFDLFSGAFNDTTDIQWHGADLYDGTVVDLKERRIRSTDGTREISVLLGLFPSAAVANLEIKLLDNFAGLDIYGVVVASNSKSDQSKCTSVLFAKKASRKINLGTDGVIPLSKFRVAVPLNSVLFVDMSLHVNGKHYKASYSLNAKHCGDSDGRPLKAKNFGDSDAQECDARPIFQVSAKWDANIESVYSEYDYQYSRPSSIRQ